MIPLAALFAAERVKWRKSWVLLVALLAPICQTGFLFTMVWFSEEHVKRFKPGFQFWFEISYIVWNLVMMPIAVALLTELSWSLEEESRAWDHLLIQPVPRRTHYLAKLLSHLSLLFLSQMLLALLLIPVGLILRTNQHLEMGLVPLQTLIRFAGFSLLASVPLVAFHTWLSTRLPGLGIGLAAALIGTWVGVRLVGTSVLIQLIPWGLSSQMVLAFDRTKHLPWRFTLGSLLCAALLVGLGTLDFARRSEPRS